VPVVKAVVQRLAARRDGTMSEGPEAT